MPLRLYWVKGRAKAELGLGRGKKLHDKREAIRERTEKREVGPRAWRPAAAGAEPARGCRDGRFRLAPIEACCIKVVDGNVAAAGGRGARRRTS